MDSATQTELVAKLGRMSLNERLHLFEVFAHNLTVAARAAWSDSALSPEEQVQALKSINECLHRATARIWVERLHTHEWKDADFVGMLAETDKALHPNLRGSVKRALEFSFSSVGSRAQ
jgi:hypothetical protein